MQSIEVTGKNIADATQVAADKLGATPQQIKVTVLEETKGLFGKSQIRVRAELEGAVEEAPVAAKPEKAPAKRATKKKTEAPAESEPEAKAVVETTHHAEESNGEESDGQPAAELVATEEDGEELLAMVTTLLEKGGLEIEVKVKELSGKYVTLSLDGKDVSHLIGKQGEVLNAFQSLINIMIGRKLNKGFRATIDSGDFRTKREEILEKLARNLADEVVKRQEEAVLDALPAFERRVVHRVLQTIDGVTTYSEGEEPNRHVVIAPRG